MIGQRSVTGVGTQHWHSLERVGGWRVTSSSNEGFHTTRARTRGGSWYLIGGLTLMRPATPSVTVLICQSSKFSGAFKNAISLAAASGVIAAVELRRRYARAG